MVPGTPEDRLDPKLKRDLFFNDLALTRRELIYNLIGVIVMSVAVIACLFEGGVWRRFVVFNGAMLSWFGVQTFRGLTSVQRRIAAAVAPEVRFRFQSVPQAVRALTGLRSSAAEDPDLASDPRLALEAKKARPLRILAAAAISLQLMVIAAFLIALPRQLAADGQPLFAPPAPPTVEFVDVTMVPTSLDFPGPVTVDVTPAGVSQIGPYDVTRKSRVQNFRSFEARGKFLVVVDASKLGWLEGLSTGATRVIDVDTPGDFVVLERDPRTTSITRDQIAAAVIGGKYLSREDVRARLK